MRLRQEAHQTALMLGVSLSREAAAFSMRYASAPTPGHAGFSLASEPTEAGLHKVRPRFVCCHAHGDETRPSRLMPDCQLAKQLRLGKAPTSPAFVSGVDLGMSARVGPAWFVREWLPGLKLAKAIQ